MNRRRATAWVLMWLLPVSLILGAQWVGAAPCAPGLQEGPLQIHPDNPRYLTDGVSMAADGSCAPIVLTGGHSWNIFQDYLPGDGFSTNNYLDGIVAEGHNFTRGWMFEDDYYENPPWKKVGGGLFDVFQVEQDYVDNVVDKVGRANDRGLYVSVMLFQGWSTKEIGSKRDPAPWPVHPLNIDNNINGIDGDVDNDDEGEEVHTLHPDTRVWEDAQKPVVHAVIDALAAAGYDNYLWEISNETKFPSWDWQYQAIQEIKDYEDLMGYDRHLVWMSCASGEAPPGADTNEFMFDPANPADLVAPCRVNGSYDSGDADPPAVAGEPGTRAAIFDSDHTRPTRAKDSFVWRTLTRGFHPIFMDLTFDLEWWDHPDPPAEPDWDPDDPEWDQIRAALGIAQEVVALVDLHRMAPQGKTATSPSDSGFSLYTAVDPTAAQTTPDGEQFLIYSPNDDDATEVCNLDDGVPYLMQKFHRWDGSSTTPTEVFATNGCLDITTADKDIVVLLRQEEPSEPPVALFKTDPPAVGGELYVPVGTTVTFMDDGSFDPDGGTLSFVWDLDGDGQFDDGTGSSVSFLYDTAGSFTTNLEVTDDEGDTATATPIVVHVGEPPVIDEEPVPQAIAAEDDATFTVAASGGAPLSYQWRKDGADLSDGGGVSGATTPTLTLTAVDTADAGLYSCRVSNPFGEVTSSEAELFVLVGDVLVEDSFVPVVPGEPLDGRVPDLGNVVWSATSTLVVSAAEEVTLGSHAKGTGSVPYDPDLLGRPTIAEADLDPADSKWVALGFSISPTGTLSLDGELFLLLGPDSQGQPAYRLRVPDPSGSGFINLASGQIPDFQSGKLNRVFLRYDPTTTFTTARINDTQVFAGNVETLSGVVPDASHIAIEIRGGTFGEARIDNFKVRLSQLFGGPPG